MSLERVRRVIMDLGLSETDAQIYVFLALNGPHKGSELTREMNIYKEQLYRSLKKLEDKTIVKSSGETPILFSAVPFEAVLDLLVEIKKEQAKAFNEAKEELLSDWKRMTKK